MSGRIFFVLAVLAVVCVSSVCADDTWTRRMEMESNRLREKTLQRSVRGVNGLAGCTAQTCGNVGASCAGNVLCLGSTFCANNIMDYPKDNFTCQAYYPNGAYCNASAVSIGRCQNACNATSNTCGPYQSLIPEGQPCSSDSQCISSYCPTSTNKCAYINIGGNCAGYYSSCRTGYCNSSSICTPLGTVGSSCDGGYQCVQPLECVPYNTTASFSTVNSCQQPYLSPIGGYCMDTAACVAGAACVMNQTTYMSYCVAAPTNSTFKSCNSNSDCNTAIETCTCNQITGNGQCTVTNLANSASYVSIMQGYNNCVFGTCANDPTCITNKCNNQVCPKYQNDYNQIAATSPACYASTQLQLDQLLYPACFPSPSTSSSSDANALGVCVWVLVAGVIAFLGM